MQKRNGRQMSTTRKDSNEIFNLLLMLDNFEWCTNAHLKNEVIIMSVQKNINSNENLLSATTMVTNFFDCES